MQTALGVLLLMADLMLAFALYNVALRFRWTVSVPAAGAVVLWLLVTVLPQLTEHDFTRGDLGVLIFVAVWAWTWGAIVRTRHAYMESLRERARQLEREREAQATIVAAAERARIAREIHDIVSHSLSVVVLMAEGASWKVRSEPDRAKEAMLIVRNTGRTALADMRRMLAVLRDGEPGSQAPQPGVAQLAPLAEEWCVAGLPVEITTTGEIDRLSEGLDLVVYRVVQEALTNARKHGGPDLSRVDVTLDRRDGQLRLRIEDDGHGDSHDEAIGGDTALELLKTVDADVVLMDVRMPRLSGVEATRRIRAGDDGPHVLILTTFDLDEYAYAALRAGASGFLLKDAPVGELVSAISHVHLGDAVVAPSTTRRLLGHFTSAPPPRASNAPHRQVTRTRP